MSSMPALPRGYTLREMEKEPFDALCLPLKNKIFEEESPIFHARKHLPEPELTAWGALGKNMGKPFFLRLALFHGEEFVGWHIGFQQSGEKFYMMNSAVLPEHRRKGLYSALLTAVVERVRAEGFQIITSRHRPVNNAVIIPKLKAGFVITSFEMTDTFGALVHLSYFTNPLRKKVLDYRVGHAYPDEEVRRVLDL